MSLLLRGLELLGSTARRVATGTKEYIFPPPTAQQLFDAAEARQLTVEQLQVIAQPLWETHGPLCDSRGFTQHTGECWNDTDQTILINSDITKDELQSFFIHHTFTSEMCQITIENYNEIIKNKELVSAGYTGFYREFSPEIDEAQLQILNDALYKYFHYFQRRFLRHYINEAQKGAAEPLCSEGLNSLQCALRAKSFNPETLGTNFEPCIADAFVKKTYEAGGNVYYIIPFILYIIHRNIPPLFLKVSEVQKGKFIEFYNINIVSKALADYAVNIVIVENDNIGHAVGFYTCGGQELFFNNNLKQTYAFPYKKFYNIYYKFFLQGHDISIVYIENIGLQDYRKTNAFEEEIRGIVIEENKEIFQKLMTYEEIHSPLLRIERDTRMDFFNILTNEWHTIVKNENDEHIIMNFFLKEKIFYVETMSYFYYNLETIRPPEVNITEYLQELQRAKDAKKAAKAAEKIARRGGTRKAKRRSKKYTKTRKHKK
jgi:hypothetical protein